MPPQSYLVSSHGVMTLFTILTEAHMRSQDVLSLLLQFGLFDVAFQLGRSLQLPLDTIYDNLAARYVKHVYFI